MPYIRIYVSSLKRWRFIRFVICTSEESLQRAIDTILRPINPDGEIVKELIENR